MNSKKRKWLETPLYNSFKSARLSYSHQGPSWSSCFLDDLEELFTNDPQQLLVFLSQRCYELGQAVQIPTLSSRTIYILMQALIAVLEKARQLEEVQPILTEILQPVFIVRHIMFFIAELEKFTYNAQVSVKVINNTIIFLHHLVSAVPEKIQDLLYLPVDMLFSKLERQRSLGFQFSWISLKQLQDLKFLVDTGFPKVQNSLTIGGLISPVETDDFQKISVFPTPQDILLDPRCTLSPNLKYGRFENELSYLDTHFRLLREDFIKPLREGISACFTPKQLFSSSSKQRKGLKLYKNVQIVKVDTMPTGVKYMARFDSPFSSWVSSKRLMTGSLVCLICDDSDEVLFATVVGYDREILVNGAVWLDLAMSHQDLSTFSLWQKCFTMLESPAFFQVYHHVLEGLQEMDPRQLPFKKYIVKCEREVLPPLYLSGRDTITYDLSILSPEEDMQDKSPAMSPNNRILEEDVRLISSDMKANPTMMEPDLEPRLPPSLELSPDLLDGTQSNSLRTSSNQCDSDHTEFQQAVNYRKLDSVNPFDSHFWCPERFSQLDKSQIEALHAALTREFVLIQGPPGTAAQLEQLTLAVANAWQPKWDALDQKLDSYQTKLEGLGTRTEDLETRVSALEDDSQGYSTDLRELKKQLQEHMDKLEDLENRSRRNNVHIVGLSEKVPEKNLVDWLTEWLSKELALSDGFGPLVIERAHRVGRNRENQERPRVVVARLLNYRHKLEVLQGFKIRRGDLKHEGRQILIFQDYSAGVQERRRKFHPLCTALVQKQIRFVLQYPAALKVLVHGQWKVFKSLDDAKNKLQDQAGKCLQSNSGDLIVVGDFNAVLDPRQDCSSAKDSQYRGVRAKEFQTFNRTLDLVDTWRILHPGEKDYTHRSRAHGTFARIDYILCARSLFHLIAAVSIGPEEVADHAMVWLDLVNSAAAGGGRGWRYPVGLHQDLQFRAHVQQSWEYYIDDNHWHAVHQPELFWMTSKAVLRGAIIAYCSMKNRKKAAGILNLERQLQKAKRLHLHHPTPVNLENLKATQAALNSLLHEKEMKSALFYKYKLQRFGNRAGRMLGRLIRNSGAPRTVTALRDAKGNIITDSRKIGQAFTEYFKTLYKSRVSPSAQKMQEYLTQIGLPRLTGEQLENLNKPITMLELQGVIKKLKLWSAPGPDGFSGEYYKILSGEALASLLEYYQEVVGKKEFPRHANTALITLIPKPGKPLDNVESYRPISLLNVDTKILAKLMAERLAEYLPSLISQEQVGFVRGRQSVHNIRKTLMAMAASQQLGASTLLLSLDAEKAFDQVGWEFMHQTLAAMVHQRLEDQMQGVSAAQAQLQLKIAALENKIEDLENRSRCNNLRLIGLPETLGTRELARTVKHWLTKELQLLEASGPLRIERAHRLGLYQPSNMRPRPVILRLLNFAHKKRILVALQAGKTFIGLKIVETLLKNHIHWRKKESPILVVCYTNHALDQFLEGIIKFQPQRLVRIGGRCKSQKMFGYSLKNIQKTQLQQVLTPAQRSKFHQIMESLHRLKVEIPDCSAVLETLRQGILSEQELEPEISADRQKFPKNQGHSQMLTWLNIHPTSEKNETVKKPDTETRKAKSSQLDWDVFQHETNERYLDDYEYDEIYETQVNWVKSKFAYIVPTESSICDVDSSILLQLSEGDIMHEEELTEIHNLWKMDLKDRWRLYRKWMQSYQRKLQKALVSKLEEYEESSKARAELSLQENRVILKKALVIGMTTTGAAKYRRLLQMVKPKIVVIEEAAEVLEAHVLTTLTASCEHLIMIGDHQQLRPKPADYTLEKKYHLGISLFERMVNNKIPYVQLQNQHRMRPEISQLLVPLFYRNLQDHSSVGEYEPIRGVETSIFFIQHEEEENNNSESESYSNKFEVSYLVSLCQYLLKQGYKEDQITIITPYTAQLLKLRHRAKDQGLESVAIKAIDDFQGEENDIILLSLVRSNQQGRIGFLKDKNRLCVAFSRARKGFFCIGNLKMLSETSNNRLWKDIIQMLQEKKLIGEGLTLVCQNHPNNKTVVKKNVDFHKVRGGGCQQFCQARLECGHSCMLCCHPDDRDHVHYSCQTKCNRIICDFNHKCPKKCFQRCGPCREKVEKVLPKCGHSAMVPCYFSADKWICRNPCERLLECKHACRLICGEDCNNYLCKEIISLNLHGSHFINTECFNQKKPPICKQACEQLLECGHRCNGTCKTCIQGRLHHGCSHKCTRVLPCTHVCQGTCIGNCPPCSRQCENKCKHSRCHKKCGARCFRCTLPCPWKCMHYTCSKACYEMCDRPRCDMPCQKSLKCKHPCVGLCGEPCPKQCRVCQKEELCEIFFGMEDEPDARFVLLEDCGHIFEVTGLDQWMDGDPSEVHSKQIQFKSCPRCSKTIQNNARYSNVIKAVRQNIEAVRRKIEGSTEEVKVKKQQLMGMWLSLLPNTHIANIGKQIEDATTFQKLMDLENTLNFFEKLDKLAMQAATCTVERKNNLKRMIWDVTYWLHSKNSPFSSQQLKECSNEIKRISYLGNIFEHLSHYEMKKLSIPDEVLAQVIDTLEILKREDPFTDCVEGALHKQLQKIDELMPIAGVRISEAERIMIVQAMDLGKGHWYKCPQGHIYTVGECGRPMHESKCPDCGDIIGGQNHNPHQGNVTTDEILQPIQRALTEHL
ncbi:NFX1-type zinc finger-containing protein 1-like [Microcaecilia unicolor]|uniref:NFX1-type zinc finger-containing protein 1-like n=1 Tax=Microcaecilia unicolor TaxID=1415580 RepID=A0A6P7X0Q3_9AMPH|nr:NFX1-type zinc finger-containing protein 1-like [Microcaecilia unicolor]